jgi:hypothetical protein
MLLRSEHGCPEIGPTAGWDCGNNLCHAEADEECHEGDYNLSDGASPDLVEIRAAILGPAREIIQGNAHVESSRGLGDACKKQIKHAEHT